MAMSGSENRSPQPASDEDFARFRQLVDNKDIWTLKVDKPQLTVWVKEEEGTALRTSKARFVYEDIKPSVLYDVLHDPYYRRKWDDNMIDGFEICSLDTTNDIGYYSLRCPNPLTNRDYVNQRSWRVFDNEYIIFNHSVPHPQLPPRKNFVRAISVVSGYVIRPHGEGSQIFYVSHSDPKGKIPAFVTNLVLTRIAPKFCSLIHQAALGYEEWKSKHHPQLKPWVYPEQMSTLVSYEESLAKQLVSASGKLLVKSTAEDLPQEKDNTAVSCASNGKETAKSMVRK